MAHNLDTIHVGDGSELAPLLDRAAHGPVRLERDGVVYRVVREDDPWAGYGVRAAIDATSGRWAALDTDAVISNIYRWREQGSRHTNRL
jgi:hypothetical protein